MTVIEFYNALCALYPTELSSSWDNDGLMLCPNADAPVKRVLVSLDATMGAIEYAKENGFDLVLTHHPLIFKGLKSINRFDIVGKRILSAMEGGICVISLHTRLDAGKDGVNDRLCSLLGLSCVESFGDEDSPTLGRIGTLEPTTCERLARTVKEVTGAPAVHAYVNGPVSRVAVVGGSGGDLIGAAIKAGADTVVTGESSYNKSLDWQEWGVNILLCGHYFSEMPVCERLLELCREICGAECRIYTEKPEICY